MSYAEASFTTGFTMALLVSLFLVGCARSLFFPAPREVAGIPVNGFKGVDFLVAAVALAFFAQIPLMSESLVGKQPSVINVNRVIVSAIAQLTLTLFVCIRFLRIRPTIDSGVRRVSALYQLSLGVAAIAAVWLSVYLIDVSGLAGYIMNLTGASEIQDSVKMLMEGPVSVRVAIAISAIVIAPVAEEVCFRGYLYPFLKCHTGAVFAAIFTSLFFGIIHLSLVQSIPLSFFGFLLIVLYEKTGSLRVPILTHMTFNTVTVLNIIFFNAAV